MAETPLRNRRRGESPGHQQSPPTSPRLKEEEVVWGKTPGGEVFKVPTTHDVLTALFHPSYPKSHFDLLNLSLLGLQIFLFLYLPTRISKRFFFCYFVFWRAAYDAGLGWVLTKQSKWKWIVREVQRRGWLDSEKRPLVREWVKKQLVGKMGKDYSFDDLPLEYNTWLLFRQVVDVILLNDFLSYCMFAFACFRVPEGLSFGMHVARWLAGIALIWFNLWVKTEAHDVVKDYGWYWGDVFFQRGALVFDGVFEFAPHPMYSVGYAGYYGLSLISGSYAVLFVSIAGHAAQFGFLQSFENPRTFSVPDRRLSLPMSVDIERTYGQRKILAQRIPIMPRHKKLGSVDKQLASPASGIWNRGHVPTGSVSSVSSFTSDQADLPTPAPTEGDTATETELETERETDLETDITSRSRRTALPVERPSRSPFPDGSILSTPASQHDLMNSYFRKDTIFISDVDLLRTSDLQLVLLISYVLIFTLLPRELSNKAVLVLHFIHALGWCLFHSFGLGLLLQGQSKNKMLVRHFLKHYPYPQRSALGKSSSLSKAAVTEAFENWKRLYNLSLCMSYVSFLGLVWKTYSIPSNWTVGTELLRHTLGAALIGLHAWAITESLEVLGVFGWFYGDFFIEDFPANLEYTGIYRYLNNPDVMKGAGYLGLSFISGNKLVFIVTVIKHLAQWWFLRSVESPHMTKLYGDTIRKEAGFVKVFKKVASRNAQRVARKTTPGMRRVAREVKGTIDKVYEETAEALEEFLAKSTPKITEVMHDTKVLLQQSREKLVITRVTNDLAGFDSDQYQMTVVPSGLKGCNRFHVGEVIRVKWKAPSNHSKKDWIGIYRVGANKGKSVTEVSSMGMWVPVHRDEWDGETPLEIGISTMNSKSGEVAFRDGRLPWKTGTYEIRYHHDGKYNVMATTGPIEVYVDIPEALDFVSVRNCLKRIVPLCLDSDPSLIPISCQQGGEETVVGADARNPDDFRFWSERQAKRISMVIEQIFGVEYVPAVIIGDANLTALANRIVVSKVDSEP
ncbi:hypothetical protein BDM02DRAFT_3181049 [Thelephora ganbajun]|uniref:Uncharacterized protein n=1 Tax=Thelephora ganbajun TaxID=370292 RepID=A0ACB6Z9G6_THEGA|nr:hypothetical protein BDM02DRAFT_3181049 [Thelephora ganbajun]